MIGRCPFEFIIYRYKTFNKHTKKNKTKQYDKSFINHSENGQTSCSKKKNKSKFTDSNTESESER